MSFLGGSAARRWRFGGLALLGLAVAAWLLQRRLEPASHGGSPGGLAWGILATLLILALVAFGWRKRAYRSRLGKLEGWLQVHLWLGLLVLLAVLFHTGWRFQDRLALTTLGVMALVVASGLVGAFLYALLPRFLTAASSRRTPAEASAQLNQQAQAMALLASGRSPAFQRVFQGLLDEATPGRFAGWRLLAGRPRRAEAGEHAWSRMLGEVPPPERDSLRALLVLSRQHQELLESLEAQQFYRNWLEVWLWVHVPASLALLVLVAVHAITALYYRGF